MNLNLMVVTFPTKSGNVSKSHLGGRSFIVYPLGVKRWQSAAVSDHYVSLETWRVFTKCSFSSSYGHSGENSLSLNVQHVGHIWPNVTIDNGRML